MGPKPGVSPRGLIKLKQYYAWADMGNRTPETTDGSLQTCYQNSDVFRYSIESLGNASLHQIKQHSMNNIPTTKLQKRSQ